MLVPGPQNLQASFKACAASCTANPRCNGFNFCPPGVSSTQPGSPAAMVVGQAWQLALPLARPACSRRVVGQKRREGRAGEHPVRVAMNRCSLGRKLSTGKKLREVRRAWPPFFCARRNSVQWMRARRRSPLCPASWCSR